MKKVLGSVLVVGVIYVGAAYLTGYFAQKNVLAQLDLAKEQYAAAGVTNTVVAYERGLFSSHVELQTEIVSPQFPLAKFAITSTTEIQHGPLLFTNGIGFGLFDATTSTKLVTGIADTDALIASAFPETIGLIHTRGHFNNSFDTRWVLPAIALEQDSYQFSIAESVFTATGTYDVLDSKGTLNLGAVAYSDDNDVEVSTSPLTATVDVKGIGGGVNLTNMDMQMAQVKVLSAEGNEFTLDNFTYVQTQALVAGRIDMVSKLALEKFSGPVEVSNLYYSVNFTQVNPDAIKNLTAAFSANKPPEDITEINAYYTEILKNSLGDFLQEGLAAKVAFGAEFMGGKPHAVWSVNYKAPADGKAVADIVDPSEYLQLADSDLLVKVPESLAANLPIDMYVGTYITQTDSDYELHAIFKGGELQVGNTAVPQAALLAMLGVATPEADTDGVSEADADIDADVDLEE